MAVIIFAFGLTYIAETFLGSISALAEVKNRVIIDSLVDNKIWQIKEDIAYKDIAARYSRQFTFPEPEPGVTINARINRITALDRLYVIDITAEYSTQSKIKRFGKKTYFFKENDKEAD